MKKTISLFIFTLCALVAHAWITPAKQVTDGENFSITVKVDDLKSPDGQLGTVSDLFASAPVGTVLPMRLWVRSGTSKHGLMLIKNKGVKGIMVGTMGASDGGMLSAPVISVEGSDLNPGYRPISKIELSYYKLDPNEKLPLCDPNIAKFFEMSARYENGIYTYKAEIEPYFPLTHIMLGSSFDKLTKNTNNIVTETYPDPDEKQQAWAAGYVITGIKVISDYGSGSFADARREFDAKDGLGKAFLVANTSTSQHYNALSGADVNEDGAVNSADVVAVYNTIIGGRPDFVDGHEYVDLGLPSGILWATCNVGSLVPEGYGDFMSWAERSTSLFTGKTSFTSGTYNPSVKATSASSGWSPAPSAFATGSMGIYSDWKNWSLPDVNAWKELLANTEQEFVKVNKVLCCKFTSNKNKKTLILPFAGSFRDQGYYQTTEDGYEMDLLYWSRTFASMSSENYMRIHALGFYQGIWMPEVPAYYGGTMRMVHEKLP